jgi:putative serine protease PepD
MNENETEPRPVDSATASNSPERGQSGEPTAAQPTVAHEAPPPWGRPVSGAPQTQPSAQPSALPAQPQPGSPWQQQQPQQPWQQGGYQQQPGYAQAQHAGYQHYQPQGAYPAWTPGAAQPSSAGGGQLPPPGEGQPWVPAEGPAWASPVATDQRPPRSGRGRRTLLAGAAAVLIALLAGGIGAATALAFDDDNTPSGVQNANSSVTRVVDRSSLAQIAAAVQDSVVSITTSSAEGSGVVRSADGYIVTNNHVVATAQGGAVTVIFADGKKASAKVVGTDPRTDLAVVKVSGVSDLHPATFGTSAKMQVGDTVLAIGSPLGLEGSVTAGIVSAKDRTIQSSSQDDQQESPFGGSQQQQQSASTSMSGLLQTDAPINPGNSGGALVNTNGEVIGINSAIYTQGQSTGNIGLGFAIPSDKAKQVADDLMAGRKVSHPALGVSVTTAENGGALVSSVTPNSAAAKAEMQQGDVITAVDGKAVSESDDVVAAVQAGTVGQKMTIDFTRDGAKKQVTVVLTEAQ